MKSFTSLRLPAFGAAALVALFLSACRTSTPVAKERPEVTRIALVSDLHVTRGTNDDMPLYPLRRALTIDAVNAAGVDLVLIAGDLTENGTPTELRDFRQAIKGFKAPVWYVPGNHDIGNKRLGKNKQEINFGRLRNYELECGRSWFVREHAGVRVVGVNSCLPGSRLPQERRMWEALETALARPAALPTIMVLHHPPFLKSLDEPGGDYFNMEPYPRARLLALAKQGGVKAVLSGHLHRGLTNDYQGILLWTTPPVSFGLPKGKQIEGWTLVTVSSGEVKAEFRPIQKIQKSAASVPPASAVPSPRPNRAARPGATAQPVRP